MTGPTPRPDAAPDVLATIERKALSLLAGTTPGRIDVHRCDAESGAIDYQLQRAPGTPATVLGYATDSDGSSRAKADATLWAHAHEMTTAVLTLAAEVRRLTAALAPRSAADLAAIGARAAEYERAGVADVAGEVGARERWGSAAHASAADVPALLARIAATRERHAAEVAAAVAAERARARRCAIYSERFDGYDVSDVLGSVRGMIESGDDDEVCEHCHDTGVNAASSTPCRRCGWAWVNARDAAALATKGAPDV